MNDSSHSNQLLRVFLRQLYWKLLDAVRDPENQIADSLQIGDEFQAGEEFTGFCLGDLGDSRGQFLVNLPLHAVEFLLAILDGEKGHMRGILKIFLDVEG